MDCIDTDLVVLELAAFEGVNVFEASGSRILTRLPVERPGIAVRMNYVL